MSMQRTEISAAPGSLAARMRRAAAAWAAAWRLADADAPGGLTRKALVLDLAERAFVSALFFSFVYRMLSGFSGALNVIILLLILGETLPFVYIVLRVPSITLSQRPTDWIFGILGTVMPLLVVPVHGVPPLIPVMVSFGVMVAGLSLQIMAKLVLGRAFGIVAANRGVKVFGPYRFMRHPIYAGYTLTQVGFLSAMPSATNALLYATALAMQVVRIFREERVLRDDAGYRAFAARVRYRLLPGVF
jgi:protein-S-isoprenylcysteine O-methyltransferase Ste14